MSLRSLVFLALAFAACSASAERLQGRFLGHYPAGTRPTTACFHPDGRILVSDREANAIVVLDASSYEVTRTLVEPGFGPWGLAISPSKDRVYSANWGGATVTVSDLGTGKQVGQAQVGLKPSYVALSPDGKRLFAAGNLTGDVAFVDLATLKMTRALKTGAKPMGVAVTPDGRWLFVANGFSQKISKVDLKHEVVLENYGATLASTTNLAITPDGRHVLAAGTEDRLLVMSVETGDVRKIRVGRDPAAVTVSPDGGTAFVANYGADSVSLVDLAAGEAYGELKAGRGVIDVATDGKRLVACNDQAGSVSLYELSVLAPAAIPPAARPGN